MKKNIFLIAIFILFILYLSIQGKVLENGSDPAGISGKIPGRSVLLKEVMRITDQEKDFIFRQIKGIQIGRDESIFVSESSALFHFTPEGRYLGNFIKIGEGPGEVKHFSDFDLSGDSVIVGSSMPLKVIRFTCGGLMKGEQTVFGMKRCNQFLGTWNGLCYFVSHEIPAGKLVPGIRPRKNFFYQTDRKGKVSSMDLSFNTKDLATLITTGQGKLIAMDSWTDLLTAFDHRGHLYLSHRERYHIVRIDLESGRVDREFTRRFEPVDYIERVYKDKVGVKLHSVVKRKYFNDIYKIITHGENLFVFTSRMNKKKEILVDVFNRNGKYVDRFFIMLPGVKRPDDLREKPILVYEGYLWATDVDEDDIPTVIKFKADI
jgi:hypothetical protein